MNMIRTALLGATALSIAVGSAALAAAPNTAAGGVHKQAAIPPKAGKTVTLFGVVNADGSLARGAHATGSTTFGAGLYEVDFDRDVTGCAYVATLGQPSTGTAAPGFITDAARLGNPNGVWVEVWSPSLSNVAENFHLAVVCPK